MLSEPVSVEFIKRSLGAQQKLCEQSESRKSIFILTDERITGSLTESLSKRFAFGRYWHLADNPAAPAFVRYWSNSGHWSAFA